MTPPEAQGHNPLHDYVLDIGTPMKNKPITPKILSPSSDASVPIKPVNENSKSMSLLGSTTPLECPRTPTIIITPPKVEKKVEEPLQVSD